ncbi:MAG TPA: cupin domain-containing protein [Rhodocyclaceae bacterium]|nr:cupin domain-containing protein [Rhodocyclaceae bacterium]
MAASDKPGYADALVRNISEVPWDEMPGHHGGALSKRLVRPEAGNSRRIDHRISRYQPMAHVETHVHQVQEQVYHVLEGEGLLELDGQKRVVRRHDVVFVPPGVSHGICNTGLTELVFIVVTSPPDDVA